MALVVPSTMSSRMFGQDGEDVEDQAATERGGVQGFPDGQAARLHDGAGDGQSGGTAEHRHGEEGPEHDDVATHGPDAEEAVSAPSQTAAP